MMSDFLAHFLTYLPTPVRFCPNINFQFYYMVSYFGKSTYLPKNRTSFMDVPFGEIKHSLKGQYKLASIAED